MTEDSKPTSPGDTPEEACAVSERDELRPSDTSSGIPPGIKSISLPDTMVEPLPIELTRLMATRIEMPRVYSDALNKAIGEWVLPLQEGFRQIGQLIRRVQTEWAPVVQSLRPVFQAIASIDWEAWWADQRGAFLAAAKEGWFIQPEMSAIVPLKTDGDLPDSFETEFINALTAELDNIEARLTESFPERAHLIKEGFLLHRERRYYSAIPMFLNSAEGIVQESTNKSPFNIQGSAPEVAEWTKQLPIAFLDRLLADALTVKHPLSQHSGSSRHRINHGRSVDYGTELASLKALSFLGFVGWLFCPNDGPLVKAAEKAGWERTSRGWKPPRGDQG